MNKRFVISVVVLFVVSMLFGFLVHGFMLHKDYEKLVELGVFRSESAAQEVWGAMIVANILIAIGMTWIYRQGRENRPFLSQGVRFGIALSLVCAIPTYLIYYVVLPLPSDLVAKQIVFDTIATVVMGIVVAALNQDQAPPRI